MMQTGVISKCIGYKCNLLTDTEVITYIIDYLVRKPGPDTGRDGATVIAAPFWSTIERKPEEGKSSA